jgi:hypothetical protein
MARLTIIISVLLLNFAAFTQPAYASKKSKLAKLELTIPKDSTDKALGAITKDAVTQKGLFTVYFNEKTGKMHLEIPDSAFQKTYMLSSRISSTSDDNDFVAGQMNVTPLLIRFSNDGRNVYMHSIQTMNTIDPADPMASAFGKNNIDPIIKGFKIAAKNGSSVVIDVTSFFGGNEKCISPIKDDNPISKLLGGSKALKGTFQSEASTISEVKTFEENIEIKSVLTYRTSGTIEKPYTVGVHRSLFVLPDNPMSMRLQDNRVGYFYNDKNIFTTNADRIEQKTYIHRWRVEPQDSDLTRYYNGELVTPKKQIVFYVDSAFPEKWKATIKAGIEEWNHAFEAAGFKNVVVAKDYPKDDANFDPDNMRYSCFRYIATQTANAMGPSYVDPRTGEILSADVIWYHNIVSLLHNWRFIQTGVVDPRARATTFDDDLMLESIKYAASHEVGHTLGLMHNMGASYSYPIESLRDAKFTQEYGTTPSIMDYARNNYVAQPGDVERGVKLTPPDLGVYDVYAINWGYRLIKGATTPESEKPTLDSWIKAKADDPMYEFGAQQMFSTIDPTDQTEDLGDDHIKAGDYGIANLKVLINNLEDWMLEEGQRYEQIEKTYMEITKQYGRYVRHVMPYVGGIRFEEIRQGDNKTTGKHYIDKAQQVRAMKWLLDQARTYDSWLTPASLIGKLEIDMNVNIKLRKQIVSSLLNSATLYRIKEGGNIDPKNNYVIDDYVADVTNAIFKAPTAGKLSDVEIDLQSAAVDLLINNSGLVQKASSSKSLSDYQEFCIDMDMPSLPCNYTNHDVEQSFTRINFGVSTLSTTEMGAIMTSCLKKVLQKCKAYSAATTGITNGFYSFQIIKIETALSNK